MTEIDVPDWVVKAAEDARVHCLNAVTAYGSAGVDERYHMAMKAALTAALGAWVVPVGYVHEQTLSDLNDCLAKPSLRAGGTIWSCQGGPYTEPLYTLRQEKPE